MHPNRRQGMTDDHRRETSFILLRHPELPRFVKHNHKYFLKVPLWTRQHLTAITSESSTMTARTTVDGATLLLPGCSSAYSTMSSRMQPHLFPAAAFQQAPLSDVHAMPGTVSYDFDQPHPINQNGADVGAIYFPDQDHYPPSYPNQDIPPSSFASNIEPFSQSLSNTSSTYYPLHQGAWLAAAAAATSSEPSSNTTTTTDYHHLTPSTHPSFSQQQPQQHELTPITTASIPSSTTDLDFDLDLDLDLDDLALQSLSDTSVRTQTRDLSNFGTQNPDGTWRCAYPGCSSHAVFRRGCDLRKHFNRHRKHLFCRYEGCPQAVRGGFSSKKDRDRHEAKHNPQIPCEWDGCRRVFSRVDNMKDHVRRIHKRRERDV
ncbi:hypothetical protein BO71DRAFT_463634 [Aspergillus ellipticus CBS 707.79]|uniref:C2H2-type domain-containing protein n=1 Tax=Aspergillus ellipticus CBS 707.79 TaxID=1448320 RepID=A0A319DG95_9EURO|nr:hypothetical protein BO71DRAFT_463634 [Aspergillus ellipticus CBS 707.79]